MWQESGPDSYMRKHLAHAFMEVVGVPAAATRYARVLMNGNFLGLYLLHEEVNADFFRRHGLLPSGGPGANGASGASGASGAWFKADHWKYSNLRQPDHRLECPLTAPDQARCRRRRRCRHTPSTARACSQPPLR